MCTLGRALVSFGVSLGPKELVAFKNSVDSNHDNQITLDEFTKVRGRECADEEKESRSDFMSDFVLFSCVS